MPTSHKFYKILQIFETLNFIKEYTILCCKMQNEKLNEVKLENSISV